MGSFITCVGSRRVPMEIALIMSKIAYKLAQYGYSIATGDATGSDKAFTDGFNQALADGINGVVINIYKAHHATPEAMRIAATYHPVWGKLSPFAQKLHGRNAFQVLGVDLQSPSVGLICWTPDGCKHHRDRNIRTGGTGTAISIASMNNIPVTNLQVESDFTIWRRWAFTN